MKCPKCKKELLTDAKFCEECGTKTEAKSEKTFCEECGTPSEAGEAFCGNCGKSLQDQDVLEEAQNVNYQQPIYQQSAYQQPNHQGTSYQKPQGKSKTWILIVAVVVLVGILGALAWTIFGKDSGDGGKEPKPAEVTQEPEEPGEGGGTEGEETEGQAATENIVKESVYLTIAHVDVSEFPKMKCYVNIVDSDGVTIEKADTKDFEIWETLGDGTRKKVPLEEVIRADDSAGMSINLVMDRSGSMGDYGLMENAKTAAHSLLTEIQNNNKDYVSITAFEDHVSILEDFTQDYNSLHNTIDTLSPGGGTALYDALYSAILRTNERGGAKCIIAFTDGEDNQSTYTYSDVVELSKQTSIPIYIIGLGDDYSSYDLENLAIDTAGKYYAVQDDVSVSLAQIYQDIYQNQLEQYVFNCKSEATTDETAFRTIEINCAADSKLEGDAQREYVPKPEIVDRYAEKEGVNRYEIIVEDATWSEAMEECERRGGYLVRINSDEEYQAILAQIAAEVDGRKQFFIGAARNPNYDEYYWVYEDGILGTERINNNPKYDPYWLTGEPSYTDIGSGMMETRLVLLQPAGSDEWVWNDVPDNLIAARGTISTKMGYICEYED